MEQKINEEDIDYNLGFVSTLEKKKISNIILCFVSTLEKHLQLNQYQDLFFEIRYIRTKYVYSRTSLARTSLSRTYPYVEVFSRSRSHCSLFQYNSTSVRRTYISKFIHTWNEFQSPITIVRTYSHIFTTKLICKRRCLRSIRFSHLSTCQLR